MIRQFMKVTPEVLIFLGSGKFEVVANPLPADARLVGCTVLDDGSPNGTIQLAIESAEFSDDPSSDVELKPPVIHRL